jgi:hypothetical protein
MKEQTTTIQMPPRNEASSFSNMRGAHIGLRVEDYPGTVK